MWFKNKKKETDVLEHLAWQADEYKRTLSLLSDSKKWLDAVLHKQARVSDSPVITALLAQIEESLQRAENHHIDYYNSN